MGGAQHDIEFGTRDPVSIGDRVVIDAAFRSLRLARGDAEAGRVAIVRRDFDTGARNMVFFADPNRTVLMPHHATLTHFPALSLTIMRFGLLAGTVLALASCGASTPRARVKRAATGSTTAAVSRRSNSTQPKSTPTSPDAPVTLFGGPLTPLAKPANLTPFRRSMTRAEGMWRPAGRRVEGTKAVYETALIPPGGSQPAGIAWMDTSLLSARLYSGSESPGGGPHRYTAPVQPASARSLVAAFNGGFIMNVAKGGYYTEGRIIDPLRAGAASLVIYADGSVNVGAWGRDVRMTPRVVAVRQNLVPLVAGGRPTARAASADWQEWGATCGASSCASSVPGIEHQWRSAVGVTANGALVYAQGPALDPLQLASLLARAGVVRGMQLDINPDWPIFATYDPAGDNGLASASAGRKLLAGTVRGPGIFFEAWWARDFITMSARHATSG